MSEAVIVVPCYNEEHRIDVATFLEFGSRAGNVRVLFVNDGSQDGTSNVLQRLTHSCPGCFDAIELPHNQGKAEAVRQGMLAALARQPRYVGFWDADLATSLDEIEPMLGVLERRAELDLVVGTRLPLLGRNIRRNRLRAFLSRRFATLASWALHLRIVDTQCGAKVFRAGEELLDILGEPFSTRWIFDVELLARMIRLRRDRRGTPLAESLYEFPLDAWREVSGSKVKPADFGKAFGELLAIYRRYLGPGAKWSPPPRVAPTPWPQPNRKAA